MDGSLFRLAFMAVGLHGSRPVQTLLQAAMYRKVLEEKKRKKE